MELSDVSTALLRAELRRRVKEGVISARDLLQRVEDELKAILPMIDGLDESDSDDDDQQRKDEQPQPETPEEQTPESDAA